MNDLNELIGKAKHGLDSEQKRSGPPEPGRRKLSMKAPFAFVLLLIAASLLAQHFLGGRLTRDMVHADLTLLTERARDSIMAYYRENQRLPAYIPDPSLRSILRYEIIDALTHPPTFRLKGEIQGVTVERNIEQGGTS